FWRGVGGHHTRKSGTIELASQSYLPRIPGIRVSRRNAREVPCVHHERSSIFCHDSDQCGRDAVDLKRTLQQELESSTLAAAGAGDERLGAGRASAEADRAGQAGIV